MEQIKNLFAIIADYIREIDKLLIILVFAASAFGCLAVMSATAYTENIRQFITQAIAMLVGLALAVFISNIDYKTMQKWWVVVALIGVVPVILTFFIGFAPAGTDDKAWLLLPGNMSFQPAELLKICFIITFSAHLVKAKPTINKLKTLIPVVLHGAFPVVLIHFQGDDGTALVFGIMFACMLFAAGLKLRYFAVALGAAIVAAPLAFFFVLNEDQKARILYLFDLDSNLQGIGYQQWMGRVAMANGGIFGQGLFSGSLTQSQGVPKGYNDFIFVCIGEELGILGCLTVLILLSAICFRCVNIARTAADDAGMFIAVGIFAMIFAQSVINLGMCMSLLPVIGITLPFFSAGGSSLLCLMCGIGVALSVHKHRNSGLIYLHK
ncbi:MAG: FtsW/RodA/SpoVE family cell cycle protein [Clostridia bacterium]|nr:FtsW/RodA/SpoVE family cell cycle protein [Clostridia bacterium]